MNNLQLVPIIKVELCGFSDTEKREIISLLNDPRGWVSQGYSFMLVDTDPHVRMIRVSNAHIKQQYPSLDGFSGCLLQTIPRVILINEENWLRPPTRTSLRSYHNYLIQHEMGHALGYEHTSRASRGDPCPVMFQQTGSTTHKCDGSRFPSISDLHLF